MSYPFALTVMRMTPADLRARSTRALAALGVLPWLMLAAIVVFAQGSDGFLTEQNAVTATRQASYLVIVAVAQYLVIVTGGLDLSVGVIFSICSVVAASIMAGLLPTMEQQVWLLIALACLVSLGCGVLVGTLNGIGVAVFNVPPFMMTLAMSSIGFGLALMLTGGTPIYGIPTTFSETFGFGSFLGVPAPVVVAAVIVAGAHVFLQYMPAGRYLFAIGSNARASGLSGIDVRLYSFLPYVLCSLLCAIAALLLTARLETGEANLGASMPLQSIAACVVGGVSLVGGKGKLRNVVLGALFITLLQNGMNLMRMDSYVQMIVIGVLLILAIVFENVRSRLAREA
jgi:ribose/xylose/arabinose/galactoside ABC-type transport system permease subunit